MVKYFIIGILILIAGVVFVYYRFSYPSVNYLIPGVPYYGFYNHFFEIRTPLVASLASILGYWGDNRFSSDELSERFPADKTYDGSTIYKFFKDIGYETSLWIFTRQGNEINQVKEFVNSKNSVPLIISQKQSISPERIAPSYRVVIGVFDNNKKIIVHDYSFGNNYEISYTDFEKMFLPNARGILAVWPSADLRPKLTKLTPDPYPERIEAMNKVSSLLEKASDASVFINKGDYNTAIKLYQEIVSDSAFNYFPPAYKASFIGFLGNLLVLADKPDEAINTITQKALPINKELNQPYEGWTGQINLFKAYNLTKDKISLPYFWLGQAYLKKGDKESARQSFEEALKISPESQGAREALEKLK